MDEQLLKTNEMPWQKLSDFPGDVMGKVLRQEPSRGAKTLLIQLKPGAEIVPHSHIGVVQHLVLSGSYDTKEQTFEEGTYRILPAHAEISPISTKAGAIILMTYDPV